MARGNLLRHIFKHGPHFKAKQVAPPSETKENDTSPTVPKSVADVPKPLSQHPSPPRTPERSTVHVLPDIAEEEATDEATDSSWESPNTESTVSDIASVVTILAAHAPVTDPETITTRDLLHAAIDEATSATNGHLHTLETTLALLEALTGFSDTVEVLRREMQDKKTAGEVKLAELQGFEDAVEGMAFPDEEGLLVPDEGARGQQLIGVAVP